MIEIELKARVENPESVKAELSHFMRFLGSVEKDDEYWSVPVVVASVPTTGFRFRVRREQTQTTVTFKEKNYTNDIEVNNEIEFGVENLEGFRHFIAKMSAQLLYVKKKSGTAWMSEDGIRAELVNVEGVGDFLEVELLFDEVPKPSVTETKARLMQIVEKCGLSEKDLEPRPYSQLMGIQ
ncbi:MAG TPA: class IV adenylate cyclase [Spirochaetales bacterium]|nr:class IV adenylate cyclase [Spirochaetales bacterium]